MPPKLRLWCVLRLGPVPWHRGHPSTGSASSHTYSDSFHGFHRGGSSSFLLRGAIPRAACITVMNFLYFIFNFSFFIIYSRLFFFFFLPWTSIMQKAQPVELLPDAHLAVQGFDSTSYINTQTTARPISKSLSLKRKNARMLLVNLKSVTLI